MPFDETVTALAKVLRKFLVCSDSHIVVLALWIIHTYCYEIFPSTPYLNIYSPEKQSGKTICMGLLNVLARKAWIPGGGTAPPRIMSRIARRRPTLLLDDWQLVFRPSVQGIQYASVEYVQVLEQYGLLLSESLWQSL